MVLKTIWQFQSSSLEKKVKGIVLKTDTRKEESQEEIFQWFQEKDIKHEGDDGKSKPLENQ